MKGDLFIKLVLIFSSLGWNVYNYLKEMNSLTFNRMRVPELIEQQQSIEEDVLELEFQAQSYRSPRLFVHLLENLKTHYIPTSDLIFTIDLSCLEKSLNKEPTTAP
jgi:hypothetical protein